MSRNTIATTTGVITIGTMRTVLKSRMPRKLLRAEQRQRKTENGLDRDRNRHKAQSDPERVQKLGIAPQAAVVVEADIRHGPAITVKLGARLKAVPQRIDEDAEHGEDGGREKQVGQEKIQPCSLPALSHPGSHRRASVIDLLRRRGARRFRHLHALMGPRAAALPSLIVAGLGQIILDLRRPRRQARRRLRTRPATPC